eukprot:Phypoly_transcript_26917.p1 GENE.Phypoly_transcript_26917~~Phypoly_transcript_26917.p1  ORF type:complete len:141 (+),score=15.00 Phypoly_transcript_26917:53-424(+)
MEGFAQTDILVAPGTSDEIYMIAPANSSLQIVTRTNTSTTTKCWGRTNTIPYFASLQMDENFCEYKNTPQTQGTTLSCLSTHAVLPIASYYAIITNSTTLSIYKGIDSGVTGQPVTAVTFGNC